jgi:hypothetical protein
MPESVLNNRIQIVFLQNKPNIDYRTLVSTLHPTNSTFQIQRMTGDSSSMDAQAEMLLAITGEILNVTKIKTDFILNCIFDRLDCSLTQANIQYVKNIRYGACFTFGAQPLNTPI